MEKLQWWVPCSNGCSFLSAAIKAAPCGECPLAPSPSRPEGGDVLGIQKGSGSRSGGDR